MRGVKASKVIVLLVLGLLLFVLGYCAHLIGTTGTADVDDDSPAALAFMNGKQVAAAASSKMSEVLKSGAVEKRPVLTEATTVADVNSKLSPSAGDKKLDHEKTPAMTTDSNMPASCSGMDTEYPVLPYDTFLRTTVTNPEYAYVTFITDPRWVRLAATLMHSIAGTGSVYARCILVSKAISESDRRALSLYAQTIEIESVPSPVFIKDKKYAETMTKLRIWELEPLFKKVLYIDSDIVLRKNIDELFDIPVGEEGLEWAIAKDGDANPDPRTKVRRTNTGLILLRPSLEVFGELMKAVSTNYNKEMTELPDLLFLNNFFDHVWPQVLAKKGTPSTPNKPITAFLSRWYHVFHREFAKRSFMTNHRQWLSIFDERVKGVHYPGNTKPWHRNYEFAVHHVSSSVPEFISSNDAQKAPFDHATESFFVTDLARNSIGFCHWRDYVAMQNTHLRVLRVHKNDQGPPAGHSRRSREELLDEFSKESVEKLATPSRALVAQTQEIISSVEPFLKSPGFLWFLGYAQMLRTHALTFANRCGEPSTATNTVDSTAAAASETPYQRNKALLAKFAGSKPCEGIVLDKSAAASFRQRIIQGMQSHGHGYPSDLYQMMAFEFGHIPRGDTFDAMYRAQLVLGAAWGFNDVTYSKRKEGSKGYFTPLALTGAPLTRLVKEWNVRHG